MCLCGRMGQDYIEEEDLFISGKLKPQPPVGTESVSQVWGLAAGADGLCVEL